MPNVRNFQDSSNATHNSYLGPGGAKKQSWVGQQNKLMRKRLVLNILTPRRKTIIVSFIKKYIMSKYVRIYIHNTKAKYKWQYVIQFMMRLVLQLYDHVEHNKTRNMSSNDVFMLQ